MHQAAARAGAASRVENAHSGGMRIALLTDNHGALEGRVADAVAGADLPVHAGDVGAGIYDRLAALAYRVVVVAGNNDPADARPSQAVTALPRVRWR